MSAKSEQVEGTGDEVCASCGVAGVDAIKLKKCACNLVKYCNVDCQKNHRPQHKKACKKKLADMHDALKRLAEMHDAKLFTQPDSSHLGECPLCCLPLPIDPRKCTMMPCCCKTICQGCDYANQKREKEAGLEQRCVYCREPAPKSQEEFNKRVMKRVKKNDPVAMTDRGKKYLGEGDYEKALEYFTKAAEFGDVAAHGCLGRMFYNGEGVEKDMERGVFHFEQAAIGGNTAARGYLAFHEEENGRMERAAKHWIISANLGCDLSLKHIKDLFVEGIVSKEDYAAALRAYQAAVDATKSAEREKAAMTTF
jgi:TPR repeat protein